MTTVTSSIPPAGQDHTFWFPDGVDAVLVRRRLGKITNTPLPEGAAAIEGYDQLRRDRRDAVDELHAIMDIFWEHAVLFKKILEEARKQDPDTMDIETLASLGRRECEHWNGSVESILVKLGEEVKS